MKSKTITKSDFQNLKFGDKCVILQSVMPDDYFNGQAEINFYIPEGFKGEIGEDLPKTPPKIKKIEKQKFKRLVEDLSAKLFSSSDVISYPIT